MLYHRDDMEHREDRLAQRHRIGLELLADDAGTTGSQGLLADLAEHLGGDLGAEALERKSARLGLGGRTGQLTAIQGTDDVVGEFAREREHLLIVAMGP